MAKTVKQLQMQVEEDKARIKKMEDMEFEKYHKLVFEIKKTNEKLEQLQIGNSDEKMIPRVIGHGTHLAESLVRVNENKVSFDYYAFENYFRGSRESIRESQIAYLPWIQKAFDNTSGEYLLDLGCGRGEFLELLKEQKIPGVGVDVNAANIEACERLNLNVKLGDALSVLGKEKNDSLIGVVAFQVAEHLDVDYLSELLDMAYVKVRQGGCLILETVNPYSFFSLRSFYIDPSHHKPIPPVTLEFFVKTAKFKDITLHYYGDVSEQQKLKGTDENVRKLNELLFGFQGYAIIAYK